MCKCVCDHCILPWTISSMKRNYFDGRNASLLYSFLLCYSYFMFVCTCYRFQTGPGRCTGGAGPHIQPRDGLGLAQCQRDACCWWPGYMKANTVALLLFFSPPSSSTSVIFLLCCPSTLQPLLHQKDTGRKWNAGGKSRGSHSFGLHVVPELTIRYPTPFPTTPSNFSAWLICWGQVFFHCYIRDFLLRESRWIWITKWGVEDWMEWEERRADK